MKSTIRRVFLLLSLVISTQTIAKDEYVFTAAPRGDKESETAIYKPVADYLSKEIGKPVRYEYVSNWLSYRKAVSDDKYDLYFDGPHFAEWRHHYRKNVFLARLIESHTFVVAVSADNTRLAKITDLAGRRICLHAEPNLATLTFQASFTNPARQPITVLIEGWKNAFKGLEDGRCVAGVFPEKVLEKLDAKQRTRTIHRFPTVPNQAITASVHVSPDIAARIKAALLADGCAKPCAKVLETFASKGFGPVNESDYTHVKEALSNDFLLAKEISASDRRLAASTK